MRPWCFVAVLGLWVLAIVAPAPWFLAPALISTLLVLLDLVNGKERYPRWQRWIAFLGTLPVSPFWRRSML